MKHRNFSIIITILFILIFSFQINAQSNKDAPSIIEAEPSACEINSVYVDTLKQQSINTNERIFVIFRAGDGEGTKTNAKRFTIVRKFLRKNKGWNDEKVLYARGEKVKGQGRIEFYLGSKLIFITMAKRGKVPCMDCCGGYDFDKGIF